MKKRLKRPRLVRWADALLPLALLALSAQGFAAQCLRLTLCALGARLLSLSTARGVRAAFAEQPSMRDVRGSVACALLAQPAGAALLAGALALSRGAWAEAPDATLCAAGLLLNLEQVFYEFLYSAGDGRSAFVSRLITAALVCAGIQLADGRTWPVAAACGIACLASAAVALTMGGGLKGRLNAGPIRFAPRFMLQDALYPAAFAALALLNPLGMFSGAGAVAAGFFSGLTLYELCRTAFRRSPLEARPLNLALLAAALAASLAGAAALLLTPPDGLPALARRAWSAVPAAAASLLAAAACAAALFTSVGRGE